MSDDSYNAHASAWAQRRRAKENISHEYLEKPAMLSALPDLSGKRVLCIGCGSGEECAELLARGAKEVVGIDSAVGLIDLARASFPAIEFRVLPMEHLDFPPHRFDFVYSSLTLHYAESWIAILHQIRACLTPGSEFIFSTHHPIKWGMEKTRSGDTIRYELSYELTGKDHASIHGDYLSPRPISETFFNEIPVTFWHRPLSALLADIRESGFVLLDFIEPLPTDEAKAKKKNFWLVHQKIPKFCMFRLRA